jgi:hypothetical protein
MKNMEVEWYSGKDLHSHPKRVKVNGVWEDVFTYEKIIREDNATKKREVVFRCHIGDNRIIEVVATTPDYNDGTK